MSRPAFYATRHGGGWRDWWTVLHPPYTAWHLSYVVIGATLAPRTNGPRLAATLVAFFFAVGVAAHVFDELHDRPLGTTIPAPWLVGCGTAGLLLACALGFVGVALVGPGLLVFIAVGPVLVLGYNLDMFGGWIHTDVGFAVAWGAFPVLTSYFVQAERLDVTAVLAAVAAFLMSSAQRALSTPARTLRRRVARVDGHVTMNDGTVQALRPALLLEPLELALRALSWGMVALALALLAARVF